MIPITMWIMWFISIGILYIILLYLIYKRQKNEKRRISELKVEKEKDWRDYYVLNKDVVELDKELEQLKSWGIRNQ